MAEQNILNTPLNAPNQETQLAEVSLQTVPAVAPAAPAAPVPIGIDQSLYQIAPATGMENFGRTKADNLAEASNNKLENLADITNLKSLIYRKDDGTAFDVSTVSSSERDSAAAMSVDQAQKMLGAGARTVGSFMDNQTVEDWGQSVVDQQTLDLEEGGYQSLSGGMSVREMFNERGAGSALGRIWEMMQENLATSGVSLVGGAAAAMTAPFSGAAAVVILGGTTVASGAMGVGESALEMEDKGVEIDDAKAIGTGILISLLDRFGAGKVIPKNLLTRMTGDAIVKRLVEKGFVDAAKGVAKTILGKAAWESGTEVAQEALIMNTASSQGAEYTRDEVIDRFIDVAFVAAGMGGTTATAAGVVEYGKAVSTKITTDLQENLNPLKERAQLATIELEELDKANAPTPVEGVPLEQPAEKVPDTPAVALMRFVAGSKYHQLPLAERTTENTQAYMDEYVAASEAAIAYAAEQEAKGTPIPEAQAEYIKMSIKANEVVEAEYAQLTEVDNVDANTAFQQSVSRLSEIAATEMTPDSKKQFLEDTLGSMKLPNAGRKGSPTSTELVALKTKLGIKDGESKALDDYIALSKSVESVSDEVLNGSTDTTESEFKGLNWHIAQITDATTRGNTEETQSRLAFLEKWADYQRFKVQKFKEVQAYNTDVANGKSPKMPDLVYKLSGQRTNENQIDTFNIAFGDGFGVDLTSAEGQKVWYYNSTATPKLIKTMVDDSDGIRQVYDQLAGVATTDVVAETVEPIAVLSELAVEKENSGKATTPPKESASADTIDTNATVVTTTSELSKDDAAKVFGLKKRIKNLKRLAKTATNAANYTLAVTQAEAEIDNITNPPILLDSALVHNTQKGLFEETTEAPEGMVIVGTSIDTQETLSDYFEPRNTKSTPVAEVLDINEDTEATIEPAPVVTEESLVGKSFLKTVKDLFKNYTRIPHILNLDKKQGEVMDKLSTLVKELSKTMPDVIESLRDQKYKYVSTTNNTAGKQVRKVVYFPMLLLAKGVKEITKSKPNGSGHVRALFDANVINIINVAAINWVATQGTSTLFNTDADISGIAHSEANARKMAPDVRQRLHTIGNLYTNIVQNIGKDIYRQLGIQVKSGEDAKVAAIHESRMITSLGMVAVENLIAAGVIEINTIDSVDLFSNNTGDAKIRFVRLAEVPQTAGATEAVFVGADPYLELTSPTNSVAYTNLIKKISGTEPRAKYPKLGGPKVLKKGATYLKSLRPIPKKVLNDVNRMNATNWKFKPDMVHLLDPSKTSREDATEFFKRVQGFMYDIENRPYYLQAGDKGRNLGILNEIKGVFEFYDQYVESDDTKPFHFSYNTGENGRHTVNETGFSYQASKLVRHLIYADNLSEKSKDGFRVEVTIGTGGNHYQYFQYAVVQALSGEVKIDHGRHDDIIAEFDRLAQDEATIAAAKQVFENTYDDTLTDYLDSSGLKAHGLDGLQALGTFLAAAEEGDSTFTTDLAIETDAITSGIMLTLMNFGALDDDSLIKLSTGGIFLANGEGEFFSNIPQFRDKTGVESDVYTMLIDPWKAAVKSLLAKPGNIDLRPITRLVTLDRNTAKPIIMQGSYMAQLTSLVSNFISGTSDGQIGKLHEKLYAATTAEKRVIYSALLQLAFPNSKPGSDMHEKRVSRLLENDISTEEGAIDPRILAAFEKSLDTVYGDTLIEHLESDQGMRPHANSMNKMVNMMSWYYRWQVQKAIDAAGGYSTLTPAKLAKIYADPALSALVPYLPTPDSIASNEGLEGLERANVADHTDIDAEVKLVKREGNASGFGDKTRKASAPQPTFKNRNAAPFVITVQSIDDAIIRGVMQSYSAMTAFDALYTSIGQTSNASQSYNQNAMEVSKRFSIFGETYKNFTRVMDLLDTNSTVGLLQYISDDTDGFGVKNFSREQFLPGFENLKINTTTGRANARALLNTMRSDLTTENALIEANRKEFFERLRVVDHMGVPGTAIRVGQENVAPKTDTTPAQGELPGVKAAPKKTPKTIVDGRTVFDTDSLIVAIAKRGGINRGTAQEVGFQDSELTTKGSRYSVFPITGGTSADGILQDLGAEFLSAYGIAADISLDDFVQLLKGSINTETPILTDEGNAAAENDLHEEGLREEKMLAKQELEDSQQELADDKGDNTVLGSIAPANDDNVGFAKADELRADNVETVFDTISGNSNSSNHTNSAKHITHLRGILKRVVSQVMESTDKYELHLRTQGTTSYGRQQADRIYVNIGKGLALNLVTPSAKESYVHELVHAITRASLSDPKANAIVRKLSATMRDVTTHLDKKYNGKGWKVFLKRDAKGNPVHSISVKEEIRAAKEAYDYIFNNQEMTESNYIDAETKEVKKNSVRTGLHEFLAYGLTNEHLNEALADMEISKYQEVNKQETVFQKLLAILENIMAWAKGILDKARSKTPAGNNAELLEQMVNDLSHVTKKYQFRTQKIARAMTAANNKVVAKATKELLKPLAKRTLTAKENALLDGKIPKYFALAFAGYINPVTRLESRTGLDTIRRVMGITKRNFVTELYREITGSVTLHQRMLDRKLMESRQAIDAQRDKAIESIAASIHYGYADNAGALSTFESESHTHVLIETNFTVLVDDWAKVNLLDLAKILSDSSVRAKAIAGVRKQLTQYGALGNYYIGQAMSLGSIMATDFATVDATRMNATLIARADDVLGEKGIVMPENMDQAEALIDKLATLRAIELNTADARQAVADVMIREHNKSPGKNGAENALILIDDFKSESLKRNFENNTVLQMAGYSKEISNPNTSIRVDTVDKEAEYKKEGYTLQKDLIPTDPEDTDSPSHMGIYVNKSGGHSTHQKFIMSLTNTNMSGHSIIQRATESGTKGAYGQAQKLVRDLKVSNRLEAKKLLQNPNYISTKPNILIPVTDDTGRVMDYRYTMGKAKKNKIFEQKTGIEMILSHMYGSIVDKEATPRVNNDVIKELHEQYREKGVQNSQDFVEISNDALTEEHREIYRMLPDSTKRYIKKLTGDDKVMVQSEFIDIVFGRKKIRLPGGDKMQMVYDAWTQTVATAKKNIVIKWPATLTMNVLSNTVFGIIYGVPIEFMMEKQAEGAIKLNNYVQDSKKLRDLELQLKGAEKTGRSTKKLLAEMSAIQTSINTSPIMPLIEAGVFQTIVEDIDVLKDPYAYATKISDFFSEIQGNGGKVGSSVGGAREAYRYAYMADDTAVFKALIKTTQFSDFAARYAKYEYMTVHEGLSKSKAMEQVMEDFVNYETPTNKYVQFANDYGLQMFTKYGFRILRVIASLMEGRPLNAVGFLLLNDVLAAGLASPFDVTPLDNHTSPLQTIASATTPSGVKMLEDAIDNLPGN